MTTTTVPTVAGQVQAAIRFTGDHVAIEDWAEDLVARGIGRRQPDRPEGAIFWGDYRGVIFHAADGPLIARSGDWIICDGAGHFRPRRGDWPFEVAEETAAPALPREVFTDPAALVDLLADAAEAHGFTVDRSEHTRRTLLLWARTLPQILILPVEGGVR